LEAHAEAKSAGVRLSVSVWETTVGPWGMVVDQLPDAGTRVRRGGRLRVIVSAPPHAPVPEVSGLPLETAIERLCWLGFVPLVKARRPSSTVPAGHVLATYPPAGTHLTDGSVVALTLARRFDRRPPMGSRAGPSASE
jgi:beta-lactam-binding protein with PASTA domain